MACTRRVYRLSSKVVQLGVPYIPRHLDMREGLHISRTWQSGVKAGDNPTHLEWDCRVMSWHHNGVLALAVKLLGAVMYNEATVMQLIRIDKCVLHILSKEDALMEHQQVFVPI